MAVRFYDFVYSVTIYLATNENRHERRVLTRIYIFLCVIIVNPILIPRNSSPQKTFLYLISSSEMQVEPTYKLSQSFPSHLRTVK